MKLSLYIITFNEERRLSKTLMAAHALADEIVVVDCGSTDRTREIAESFGARIIHNDWVSFGDQVRVAEELCTYDWVLRLDADEVISPELVEEIKQIKLAPDCDGYRLRIGEVYPGVEHPKRWVKHLKLIRLYNRTKMKMLGILDHDKVDMVVNNAKVRTLNGFVHHYSYINLTKLIEKQNRATDTLVRMVIKSGHKYSPWRMVGAATLEFLKYYLLNRHFLYGFYGYIFAVNMSYFRFAKFGKYYDYTMGVFERSDL